MAAERNSNGSTEADILAQRLEEARDAYYNSEHPIMGDAEFDNLEEQLRLSNPAHRYFSTVGIADAGTEKIKHRVPMLSMGKAKTMDEVEKWLRRLELTAPAALTVQPKIDGLSASLFYDDGKLIYVATRGDGTQGQDISHVASYISDIPQHIYFTREPVEIRGELYLPRNTDYDTGGRPLRNNCVGLINRKDHRESLRHIRFLAYQIVWPESARLTSGATVAPASVTDSRLRSEIGKIAVLAEEGFYTFEALKLVFEGKGNDATTLNTGDSFMQSANDIPSEFIMQLDRYYRQYIGHLREHWNYETDGLVILVDDNRLHDAIDERWVVDHHHHYVLAIKPPSPTAETPLKDIIWQVSRQGNLTPVALFHPIEIGGAKLERASLHNAENVRSLKLSRGDLIQVERANDVIPYVRANNSASDRPENYRDGELIPVNCPSCQTALVENGVNIQCTNPECRDRVLQSILYWVRQSDVDQVALKTLEALYDAGKLRRVSQLYTLSPDDFKGLEGFAHKKIANFIHQIASSRRMSATSFISRLGIPMVQKNSLSRLGIGSLEDFFAFADDTYAIGRSIIEWKADKGNMKLLNEILTHVEIIEEHHSENRRGVLCLTGTAPVPRKALIAALEENGWTVSAAVTRHTAKVLCDNPQGNSTKLKKARAEGIAILSYQEFFMDEGLWDELS